MPTDTKPQHVPDYAEVVQVAQAAINQLELFNPFAAGTLASMLDKALNGTAGWLTLEEWSRKHPVQMRRRRSRHDA